ncbi:hypothetical protein ACNOYE_25860 [Nannocystaceae bacterium ST9]
MQSSRIALVFASLLSLAPTTACITDDGGDATDEVGDTGTTGDTDTGETGDGTDTTDGAEETCVSGTFWTQGNQESPRMHPGGDCLDCHQSFGEAAQVVLAGTVYTNSHELDDCNGVAGVTVLITDSNGTNFQTTTNSAGNFLLEEVVVVPPYSAALMWEGRMREMVNMQTVTSCNSCHTETGAQGAPGRILAP